MIRIIHRLWLGPRPMPARYRYYGTLWEYFNPEWKLKDWSWHNLPETFQNDLVLEDMRKRCTSGLSVELPTALADVISYELVAKFGGIYANTDIQPVRPLGSLGLEIDAPWATYEEENYSLIVNAFFGAPDADNPFWQQVVGRLQDRYFGLNKDGQEGVEMVFSSGPHHLTEVAREVGAEYSFRVLPYYTVNPVLWKDIAPGTDATSVIQARGGIDKLPFGCVGIHHWGHKLSGRSNVVR